MASVTTLSVAIASTSLSGKACNTATVRQQMWESSILLHMTQSPKIIDQSSLGQKHEAVRNECKPLCNFVFFSTVPHHQKRQRGRRDRGSQLARSGCTMLCRASNQVVDNPPPSEREQCSGMGWNWESCYALSAITVGLVVVLATTAGPAEALSSLHNKGSVDADMTALALGPEGPLVEEFWENVSRYVAYFFTVATGGAYTLVKPIIELLQKPVTAVLVIAALSGGFFVMYLTLSAMLGLDPSTQTSQYQF